MSSFLITCVAGWLLAHLVAAQSAMNEHIWSVVAFTRYGDRLPVTFGGYPVLTPLGAQQLYSAGAFFRQRYIAQTAVGDSSVEVTRIRGISPIQLEYPQVTIVSTNDQFVFASAQACAQGLYPPLVQLNNDTIIAGVSLAGNGLNIVAPLDGYQYANILTASSNDFNSIYVAGQDNCPAYEIATFNYLKTSAFSQQQRSSQTFYNSLQPYLSGVFANSSIGYVNAYQIWDYLNYQYNHNYTFAQMFNLTLLTQAKYYADEMIFAQNANLSASGDLPGDEICAISGRTLAERILQAFYTNIETQGGSDSLTLLFGSFEPMVAFAALAQLPNPSRSTFYSSPTAGASFVFELYTLESLQTTTYPSPADLWVRFLYRTGSGPNDTFIAYPLFGRGVSEVGMPLADFIAGMNNFAIPSVQAWCTSCGGYSNFCLSGTTILPGSSSNSSGSSKGLKPVIAGVIGAAVALVVAALVFGGLMLFGGVRLNRIRKGGKSELAGFKGSEKLASDQDLVIPKNGATTTTDPMTGSKSVPRERVGSWELKDQDKAKEIQHSLQAAALEARPPSFEEDDFNVSGSIRPTRPRDHV